MLSYITMSNFNFHKKKIAFYKVSNNQWGLELVNTFISSAEMKQMLSHVTILLCKGSNLQSSSEFVQKMSYIYADKILVLLYDNFKM